MLALVSHRTIIYLYQWAELKCYWRLVSRGSLLFVC